MDFSKHLDLIGQHAFLSASNYHWINYDDEKLERRFLLSKAAARGTELHAFANSAIRLGIRLPANGKSLNAYVNDAIGYRMSPEQPLVYSRNVFGTADTISFRRQKLRIHDYKSGEVPGSVHQLEVYAALFCLEYKVRPFDISMEFRIYQNDEIQAFEGDPTDIVHIMDKAITFDKRIEELRKETE